MACTDVKIFWHEVTKTNKGPLKQKKEIYDKECGGSWNKRKKTNKKYPELICLVWNF